MTSTARRTHLHQGRAPHREDDRRHRHHGDDGQQRETSVDKAEESRREVTRQITTLTLTEHIDLRSDAQAVG